MEKNASLSSQVSHFAALGFIKLLVSFRASFLVSLLGLGFLSLSLLDSTAYADQIGSEASKAWVAQIRQARMANRLEMIPVDLSTYFSTYPSNQQVYDRLLGIGFDQAQIWADTILGGEFLAEQDVLIEKVELLRDAGVNLGYRITYASAAYDTMDCDPQLNIQECQAGKIVESSFVSPDFLSWIRDEQGYAAFIPTPPKMTTGK